MPDETPSESPTQLLDAFGEKAIVIAAQQRRSPTERKATLRKQVEERLDRLLAINKEL